MELSQTHHHNHLNKEEESDLETFIEIVSDIGFGKQENKLRVWWRNLQLRKGC